MRGDCAIIHRYGWGASVCGPGKDSEGRGEAWLWLGLGTCFLVHCKVSVRSDREHEEKRQMASGGRRVDEACDGRCVPGTVRVLYGEPVGTVVAGRRWNVIVIVTSSGPKYTAGCSLCTVLEKMIAIKPTTPYSEPITLLS